MPHLIFERAVLNESGFTRIAGLDEAGRGALAGPVVAGAVILPLDKPECLLRLRDVDDSKKVNAYLREELFEVITSNALCYGIGVVGASEIDSNGIIAATKLAMQYALTALNPDAQYLLIDGRIALKSISIPQQSLIRGDSKSLSIASASILAKVMRDRIMIAMDCKHPQYGFSRHKGYGTVFHRKAIEKFGPISEHRFSFAPIRSRLI